MSRVKDMMITQVETCSPDTNLAEAGGRMWEKDCGILPVVDNEGKVLGVITDRDICISLATRALPAFQICVKDVLADKLYSCKPEEEIKNALATMRTSRVRRLPVVDGEGKLVGLLSLDDIAIFAQDLPSPKGANVTYKDVGFTFKNICGRRDLEVNSH